MLIALILAQVWSDDLDAACAEAKRECKVVLCRRYFDDAHAELARHPWWLGEIDTTRFVLAAVRGKPDPETRISRPVNTLFLAPGGQTLHTLDECPYAIDVAGEIGFMFRARHDCFEGDGSVKQGGLGRLDYWHRNHRINPDGYHVSLNRLDATWHTDLEKASRLAKESSRLILYFQVAGDLNSGGC